MSPTDAERKRIAQLSDDDTYLDVHGLSRPLARGTRHGSFTDEQDQES